MYIPRPIHIYEGLRFFKHRLAVGVHGVKKYQGNAKHICKQVIDACWNGEYFQTSAGHYNEFYTRDFGFCTEALLKLGYRKKVLQTLEYALAIFSKANSITTTISPEGLPFNFPYYSVDSLPLMIRSLRLANAKSLIKQHKAFLNNEINRFYNFVIDKETGLVTKKRYFSSMKDYSKRKSSCYDNVMAAMLKEDLKKLKILDNPLKNIDFKKNIKDSFWTGKYFLDDLSGTTHVSGDANVFPFWTGVFTDKSMMKKTFGILKFHGLDEPFPLKYTTHRIKEDKMIFLEFLVPNWERHSIWAQMGPIYIGLIKKTDRKQFKKYTELYKNWIEKNGTYLEVFDSKGKPLNTLFYHADEGMIWASMFLELIR